MFNFIRRHQGLALVFILLVCLSFVIFFTNQDVFFDSLQGNQPASYGSIYGRPIDREEYVDAYNEARMSFRLRFGDWPSSSDAARNFGFDLENETLNRLFVIEQLKRLGVKPDDQAVAEWIAQRVSDENGNFNREFYEGFVSNELRRVRMDKSDFHRFARHEVGLNHLISLAGLPGSLVPPSELKTMYRDENRQADTAAVFFSTADHLANVDVNPDAIARYFTNTLSRYRLPERRVVTYVQFEGTNFWYDAEAVIQAKTNLTSQIDKVYQQRGKDFYTDDNGDPLPAEVAKQKIRDEVQQGEAIILARKEAINIGQELFEMEPVQSENLENLAAARGYLAQTTEPFDNRTGPESLKLVDRDFVQTAFQLSEAEPFSTPVIDGENVFLLAYKETIPSEVPPLDEVRDKVIADYRDSQARSAVRLAGSTFRNKLEQGLEAGKSIEEICMEEQKELVDLPPFSKSSTSIAAMDPRLDLRRAQQLAFELEEGEISNFTSSTSGGFVLYLQNFIPVDETAMNEELNEFAKDIRTSRRYLAFNEWFRNAQESARILGPNDGAEESSAPSAGTGGTN